MGIPAHKHPREQHYADVESVVVGHLHREQYFFQQITFQKEGYHQQYLGVPERYQNQYSKIPL